MQVYTYARKTLSLQSKINTFLKKIKYYFITHFLDLRVKQYHNSHHPCKLKTY